MKEQVRTIFVAVIAMFVVFSLVAHSSPPDGLYLDGSAGSITHYLGGTIDWQMPLEGNYSTWTEIWNTAVADIHINRNHVIVNLPADEVCFVSYTKAYRLKLSTGELLETISIPSYGYASDYVVGSILGKYLVVTNADVERIHIYKDGVLTQTITLAGDVIVGVGISSDGKYIVAGLRDVNKIYCFEGS